jgi:low temperature requirement protein LtrA
VGFWVPGLGRSMTAEWDVEGGHMAERCGLFIGRFRGGTRTFQVV